MRTRGAIVAAFALVAMLAGETSAQTENRPRLAATSRLDVADCLDAADQPICILRALAHFPTHNLHSTDWRIAGSPEVIEALGETDRAPNTYGHIRYASTRYVYGSLDGAAAASAAAIVADRRGATPEEAMEILRGYRGLFSGCVLYKDIWEAYGTERERTDRPRTPRPSRAFTEAAVRACEALEPTPETPELLAAAYLQLGDREGARREMLRDSRHPTLVALIAGVMTDDFDSAGRAALAEPPTQFGELMRFNAQRGALVKGAAEAGRVDVAVSVAGRMIDTLGPERQGADPMNAVRIALRALAQHALREQVVPLVERVDVLARDTDGPHAFRAANAAAEAWWKLGEPARVRQIVEVWRPVALATDTSQGCGGDRPPCYNQVLAQMLRRIGDEDGALAMSPSWPLSLLLSSQLEDGIGFPELDAHLARARSERARIDAFHMCATNRPHYRDTATADECLRRLMAGAATAAGADQVRHIERAGDAALYAARVEARRGRFDRMRTFLRDGLTVWRRIPDGVLQASQQRENLREVAIALLEDAGRLQ